MARGIILVAVATALLAACTPLRLNPATRTCTSDCVEKKNACMLVATAVAAVATCDEAHHACVQPCLAMPRYISR